MNTTRYCPSCGEECSWEHRFCQHCRAELPSTTKGQKAPTPRPAAPQDSAQTELGLPIGAVLANRYRIVEILGMGGMGRVYLAEDQQLETRVAIKVLREVLSRDPGAVKRLIAEARHSMTLSHPNVVRVHNFEDGEMVKFLVMEYVEGGTLAGRIADQGKLTEEEARRIAIEACKGLEHAHEQKVIHRDIKPGNILLGKSGAVKIADFGIARECRDSVSHLTSQVDSGTLLYMSPEQVIGKSSEASDVYSFGVVLYEMLTGQPPFRSGDITYQIRGIVPDPPAGVAPELSAIVLKCLEKKPERRFASVRALREELDGTAEAKRKAEEARAAELRRAEEERRKQAEIEANRRKEEERRQQEEASRGEVERKKAAAGLAAAALTLVDRDAFDEAETKLQEALSLDPAHAEAKAALDRCRAEKAAAEERRQRSESPKTVPVVAKPSHGRRAAIGLLAVGVIAVVIWITSSMGTKKQGSDSAGLAIEPTSSSPVDTRKISSAITEMEFVSIPAGKFMMGCSVGDDECSDSENPRHEVIISRTFELGKYEVTQGQWVKAMGNNPSNFKGDDSLPVEQVSWNDAQAFIAKLNALNDGYRYRLPTEAEWEYAVRGGTTGPRYGNLDAIAWYSFNSGEKTHPVGQKQPNGYGLYDMLGNVWEWCSDWFGASYYGGSPAADPTGRPTSSQIRVRRGGSWRLNSGDARVSNRGGSAPGNASNDHGFRVCREKR